MKIYKSQQEVEKDIKNGVLKIDDDVKFECSISIIASIKVSGNIDALNINALNIDARDINAWDINAWDIDAFNINAWNINAGDINAYDINAGDINALNIDARDINAGDINARNIDAYDINAGDINAGNILYCAFCGVYNSIKCLSIKAKRDNHSEPTCLDGKLEIKQPEQPKETIQIGDHTYSKEEVEERLKGLKEVK